jgi:CheY-like chemotaxis protein
MMHLIQSTDKMAKFDLVYTIDDDAIASELAGLAIRKAEVSRATEEYANGEQALRRLQYVIEKKDRLPGLILLDLDMPVMDGWQFLDEYSKMDIAENICLFIYSSTINPADLYRSYSYKAVKGFIQKPLNPDKLNKIIHLCSVGTGGNLHPGGELKWDMVTGNAYHPNGRRAYDKFTGNAYHSNGEKAYNHLTGNAYYSNGLLAYSRARNEYYTKKGDLRTHMGNSLSLGPGIRLELYPKFKVTVFRRKIDTAE